MTDPRGCLLSVFLSPPTAAALVRAISRPVPARPHPCSWCPGHPPHLLHVPCWAPLKKVDSHLGPSSTCAPVTVPPSSAPASPASPDRAWPLVPITLPCPRAWNLVSPEHLGLPGLPHPRQLRAQLCRPCPLLLPAQGPTARRTHHAPPPAATTSGPRVLQLDCGLLAGVSATSQSCLTARNAHVPPCTKLPDSCHLPP